jgi:hypothetical protein
VVLCSDTRLDYGDLGSTNFTVKVDILGHGWSTQLAGEWSGVIHLCKVLKSKMCGRPTPKKAIETLMYPAVVIQPKERDSQ